MKFTLPVKTALDALNAVAGVVPTRSTIAILGFFRIVARDGEIEVSACDLEREASARAIANVERPGEICVAARRLHDAVKLMPKDAALACEFLPDTLSLRLVCGRSRFLLPTLPAADFPQLAAMQGDAVEARMPGEKLAAWLDAAAPHICQDTTRFYLQGAHLNASNGHLRFVSTNGHTAYIARTEIAIAPVGVTLPENAVRDFAKLAASVKGAEVVLRLGATLAALEAGPARMTSKLLDGTWPDVDRVVPADFEGEFTVDRAEFLEAIARVRTMTQTRKIVEIDAAAERLKLTAKDGEGGEAVVEISTREEVSRPFVAMFQAVYLADMAGSLDGEFLTFAHNHPGGAMKMTCHGGAFGVVMPTR
jgi:DNA polymerase-3 subunit beta